MPIPIPAAILGVIFITLSAIHILWVLGVKWGLESSAPTSDGVPLFNPGKPLTLLVAALLLAAAFVTTWRVGLPNIGPAWIPRIGMWVFAVIFAIRAVGDFQYCGFFKRVRDTRFARNDSFYFSPLCIIVSILATYIALTY